MVLTVAQLLSFDPARLAADAEAWQRVADDLTTHADGLRHGVAVTIAAPAWDGAAAWAARARVDTLGETCAVEQRHWAGTAALLRAASASLAEARGRLVAAAGIAAANGLVVSDGGTVVPSPAAWAAAAPPRRVALQGLAATLTGDVTGVLALASDVDETTTAALLAEPDTASGGGSRAFSSPEQAAQEFIDIASDGVDSSELPRVLEILQAAGHDPAFSAAVWSTLGVEHGMQIVQWVADTAVGWQADTAAAATVHDLLALTLSHTVDPASSGYLGEEWVADLLSTDRPAVHYARLGVLLTEHDFPTEFLLRAGDTFEAVENGDAGDWLYPWSTDIDLDSPSQGNDPFDSFMQALARNEDAAQQFFDPATHPDRLEYHLEHRDPPPSSGLEPVEYADRLGATLEVAVGGDPHDAVSAHIMSETVYILGSPEHLNGDVPGPMRDSVGRMMAEYVGDVNATMSADHAERSYVIYDENGEVVGRNTDFDADRVHPDGVMSPGAGDEAHAIFDPDDMLRVMASAAADEDGYTAMYQAQSGYTALVVNDTLNDTSLSADQRYEQVVFETDQLSKVFGAIDHARAVAVEDLYQSSDAEHNQQLNLAEQGVQKVAGFLVSRLTQELLDPLPGDGLISSGVDQAIKFLFGLGEQDSTDAMTRAIADVYEGGRDQTFAIARAFLEAHGMWDDSALLYDASGDGYTDGRSAMDEALGRP